MAHSPNSPLPSKPSNSASSSSDASVHITADHRDKIYVNKIARGLLDLARFQIQLERFLAELPKPDSAITEGDLYDHRAFFWHDEPFIAISQGQLAYRVDPARNKHIPRSRSEPRSPASRVLDDWHVLNSGPDTWLDHARQALELVMTESDDRDNIA